MVIFFNIESDHGIFCDEKKAIMIFYVREICNHGIFLVFEISAICFLVGTQVGYVLQIKSYLSVQSVC
jgi:hypothetical protein